MHRLGWLPSHYACDPASASITNPGGADIEMQAVLAPCIIALYFEQSVFPRLA